MINDKYKIFDGTSWVSPCAQDIRIYNPNGHWDLLDVYDLSKEINYYDGSSWVKIECPQYISCSQSSLSGSGGAGIYYIPMILGPDVCDLNLTLDINTVPDSATILSYDKSIVYAQTGFFGSQPPPPIGNYTFGNSYSAKIYTYSNTVPGNFILDSSAPDETISIVADQFPITNTLSQTIPISINPAFPLQTIRTITYTKGVTTSSQKILIRIVGNPTTGTNWQLINIACVDCGGGGGTF